MRNIQNFGQFIQSLFLKHKVIYTLSILGIFSLIIYFTQIYPGEDIKNSSSVYKEPTVIVYQVDSNYPPFSFVNEGDLIGFDFYLTNIIFPTHSYILDYSTDTWDNVYSRLVNEEIDLAGIIAVTEERKKEVLFTKPLFNSYVSCFTLQDFGSITIDDLSTLKVGVGSGYYTESILKNELKIDYIAYSSIQDAIDDLQNGTIDVLFENSDLIRNILIKQNLSGIIISNLSNLYPREHAYAVSKNHPEIVTFMNTRIDELIKNDVFEEIYMSYFYEHSDTYYNAKNSEAFALGLIIVAAIIGVLVILGEIIRKLKAKLSLKVFQLEQTNAKLTSIHQELQDKYVEIRTLAYINMVTGLPNRNQLRHDINEMIKESHSKAVLMMVDLDRFNEINDAFGHTIGDSVIREISTRFKKIVPDEGKLYNVNGEEFVFVGRPLDREIFKHKARQVLDAIHLPINANENEIRLTGGIGVVFYPEHGHNFDELIRNLDIAMMQSKRTKNEITIFEERMGHEFEERTELHKRLRTALENKEFVLHYQPIIEISTNSIKGFEALIRWNHPLKGIQSPYSFIPAAEESRLIIPIGSWVIEEACRFIKSINETLKSNFTISINISSIQIIQDDFILMVKSILNKCDVKPNLIEFEITESIFLTNIDYAIDCLKELQSIGISISIDDFGTGYSSLSYIKDLPLNVLKIDKSFIDTIHLSDKNLSLAQSIISIGHTLGLSLIAEGVEDSQQLKILQELKCDQIQGYLISKPLSLNDLIKFIHEKTS
jgi:diguanylate cyclase (GGDEF)-like protein